MTTKPYLFFPNCSISRFHTGLIAAGLCLASPLLQAESMLEEIIVTAQKRDVGLQDSALSISAISGETLEKGKIFNVGDLARSTAGLSFTNPTPFDMELNIRGVMNTRLDAPSASRSIGIFFDEVVVGRMGLMSTDFYDLERVEVLRGPQGVLLGKNVVGGAINIIAAKPKFDRSGSLKLSAGNLGSQLIGGHVTGGLSDSLAARFAFQVRKNDGFAENALTGENYHDIDSLQSRLSFHYQNEQDLSADLTLEYLSDEGNGTCAIGEGGNPWAVARDTAGLDDIRKCLPEPAQYSNAPAGGSTQGYDRDAISFNLKIEKDFDAFTLTSITGYRKGDGESQYSQTGIGPDAPGVQAGFNSALGAGDAANIFSLGFAFDFPVREREELKQFTQEIRLTSANDNSDFDWIFGVYFQKDEVDKFDRFWSEILIGSIGAPVGTLNGESTWDNSGEIESQAIFGQLGYQISDNWKVTLGGRYTKDETSGNIIAVAVETGDKFSPNDATPLTPLNGEPDGAGGLIFYTEGGGYSTKYADNWSETTLSGIVEYTLSDDILLYGSISEGYKSGGFQDTPGNSVGARLSYEPETVLSYELGIKSEFLAGSMRVNAAIFNMDYQDLQVEFTDDQCLCNIVSNASDASIKGIELEVQYAATDALYTWLSASYVDTEYKDYVISTGDFSGNQLQRTPETQINLGAEYTMNLASWDDALSFRINYTWQDDMPWAHTNVAIEDDFALIDARIQLAPLDAPWRVSLWIKNATDEDVRANVIEFFGGTVGLYAPPRTYGLDFSWSFH